MPIPACRTHGPTHARTPPRQARRAASLGASGLVAWKPVTPRWRRPQVRVVGRVSSLARFGPTQARFGPRGGRRPLCVPASHAPVPCNWGICSLLSSVAPSPWPLRGSLPCSLCEAPGVPRLPFDVPHKAVCHGGLRPRCGLFLVSSWKAALEEEGPAPLCEANAIRLVCWSLCGISLPTQRLLGKKSL